MIGPDHLAWGNVYQFYPLQRYFPPPFSTVHLEGIYYVQPTWSGGLCSTSLKVKYLHSLSEIILHERFVSLLIYLLTNVFISVQTHGYLFYTSDYNLIPLYLVAQNCYSFDHWMLLGWLKAFWNTSIILFLSILLLSDITRHSRLNYIFLGSKSSGNHSSIYWRMILKPRHWCWMCSLLLGLHCFEALSADWAKK